MYKRISFWSFLFFPVFFFSCEEKIDWTFGESSKKLVVIDGIITNETKKQQIIISETFSSLNGEPEPLSEARVSVFEGAKIRKFREKGVGTGIYESEQEFAGVINSTYVLYVRHAGKLYTASARMIPVTPIPDMNFVTTEDSLKLSIGTFVSEFDLNESSMYEVTIDRRFSESYPETGAQDSVSLLYYYTLSTLDVHEIFAPKREEVIFPVGTRIVVKKYSLTPRHAEFVRSLLSETVWRGGYFDVEQDNIRTNLSSGAVGYFGACSVVSDTIFAQIP